MSLSKGKGVSIGVDGKFNTVDLQINARMARLYTQAPVELRALMTVVDRRLGEEDESEESRECLLKFASPRRH